MLCITRTVGNQCAIYDTDDGTIEWHTTDTVKQFESGGMQFRRGVLDLQQSQCNFGKNGENIFSDYKIVHHGGDKYELVSKSAGRKLKFRLQNGKMCFNIGVNVSAQGVGF
ncbi:MAG: hypothetical protein K2P14_01375 [Anaeroplasmataceae bacterium]|nr:hypothetical protein [Anaeroplasmataceae bacterium]